MCVPLVRGRRAGEDDVGDVQRDGRWACGPTTTDVATPVPLSATAAILIARRNVATAVMITTTTHENTYVADKRYTDRTDGRIIAVDGCIV